MTPTESILIVIIVLLIVYCARSKYVDTPMMREKSWNCVDKDTGAATTVKIQYACPPGCACPKCRSPENQAMKENFAAGAHSATDTNESYVNYESSGGFGDSNQSYKDFITSMSVDPQTLRNHGEFVQDRLNGQNQNITGRTYAISEPVEGNDIPWSGLRRPQLIPTIAMGNPTQMPDVRESNYTLRPTFSWNSSPSNPYQ